MRRNYSMRRLERRHRKPCGAAARADDRHLHGAGHLPADDGGVLAHGDPGAETARPRMPRSSSRHRDWSWKCCCARTWCRWRTARPDRWQRSRAPTRRLPTTSPGCRNTCRSVKAKFPDMTDATLLLEKDIPYDALVQVMDTMRILEQRQGTQLVQAELFPNVSIGDAPETDAPARRGRSHDVQSRASHAGASPAQQGRCRA